jgi:hypothetical protein
MRLMALWLRCSVCFGADLEALRLAHRCFDLRDELKTQQGSALDRGAAAAAFQQMREAERLLKTSTDNSARDPATGISELGNAPYGMQGLPVIIYTNAITASATQYSFPPTVLLSSTIAHEVGHKFSLPHYSQINSAPINWQAAQQSPSLIQAIGPTDYVPAMDFMGLFISSPIVSGTTISNFPVAQALDLMSISEVRYSYYFTPPDGATTAVVKFTVSGTMPTPPTQIQVNILKNEIMDWSSQETQSFSTPASWHFDPVLDLPHICIKRTCSQ